MRSIGSTGFQEFQKHCSVEFRFSRTRNLTEHCPWNTLEALEPMELANALF
jgi:hypothetical protein